MLTKFNINDVSKMSYLTADINHLPNEEHDNILGFFG